MAWRTLLGSAALVVAAAGCGSGSPGSSTTTSESSPPLVSADVVPSTSSPSSSTPPPSTLPPSSVAPTAADLSDAVGVALSDWVDEHDVVGAAVLVARGDVTTTAVSGRRSVDDDQPIEAGDRFAIGSLTKPFAAALVLQLVEVGEIALDDPVADHLPGAPPGLTVEDLLGHTSGYLDGDIESQIIDTILDPASRRTLDERIAEALAEGPVIEPGERQRYASVNYLFLDGVIAAATGSSFEDELTSRLLEPLELSSTGFASSGEPHPSPHERPGPGQPPLDLTPFDTADAVRASGASGALISTTFDLARFTRALFDGDVIGPDSLARMVDAGAPRVDYGLGISVDASPAGIVYGHNGRTIGYAASLRHDNDHDVTVVVLSNDGGAPTELLADGLVDLTRDG